MVFGGTRPMIGVAVLVMASGCATITRGVNEALVIESDPSGAEASLSNGLRCTTPCSVSVKRRGDIVVTLEKEGYETVSATVTSSIDAVGSAAMAGNLVSGGIVGAGIDAGTGAMHSHKPNPLVVKLERVEEAD